MISYVACFLKFVIFCYGSTIVGISSLLFDETGGVSDGDEVESPIFII